jgi:multidrug resistance efflux pump
MTHPYHSGSRNDVTCKDATKVKALVIELDRRVRLLENDIVREEELAGALDPRNAAYPALARTLTAHRDNLKQTIAALEQRLDPEAAQIAQSGSHLAVPKP